MGANDFVHQGLCHGRRVLLVVAQFTETNDVDCDVFLKLTPKLNCQLRCQYNRLWVIAIDMQYRRIDYLHDVGAIQAGAQIAGIGRGKSNLIINHNVDRAASGIATDLRHRQGLLHDALTSNGRIAMH